MTDDTKRRDESRSSDGLPSEKATQSLWARLADSVGTAEDQRNQRSILIWTLAWVLGLTAAAQTLNGRLGLEVEGLAAWVLSVVPGVLAVVLLFSYLRFLRMTDELTRLIHLQALAVGFIAVVFLLLHWELFEAAGAPAMDPSDAAMVPIFAFCFGLVAIGWRYR